MGIDILTIWNSIVSTLRIAWSNIQAVISTGMTWIATTFTKLSAPIREAWDVLWTTLGASAASAWDIVKQSVVSSINWIIDKINKVIQAANRLASAGA